MNNFNSIIAQLEENNTNLLSKLNSLKGQSNLLNSQISTSKNKLEQLSHKKLVYSKSVELLSFLSEITKQQTKEGFNSLITYALRYVFGEPYKFSLEFGRRGNYEEVDFKILAPNREEANDPINSEGGGLLDLISLALRIVLLELSRPKNNSFLILDEPCKHLSLQYRPKIGKFFEYISQKTNRQLIIITHFEELKDYADKSIKIGN